MDHIIVIDTFTGAQKQHFIAPAGLLVTARIAISALRNCSPDIELIATATGQYLVQDSTGEDLARYDIIQAAKPTRPARDGITPKQQAYLARLINNPPYEMRGEAERVRRLMPSMTKAQASLAISRLTWGE